MFWMLFTIAFALLSGPLMLATKPMHSRNGRFAAAMMLQGIVTLCGWGTVLSGDCATRQFDFTEGLSAGFASDQTARFFCAVVVTAWMLVTVYATVYMKHEENEVGFFLFAFSLKGLCWVPLSPTVTSLCICSTKW